MSTAQTITVPSGLRQAPLYPFLSQPPPQKKRPTKPLPSPPVQKCPSPIRSPNAGRRRSATTSSIVAWAANVHPGSPAPYTPRRSPSAFSITIARRSSFNSTGIPSSSFLSFADTPSTASKITPSMRDFKPDLIAVGYTSIFVNVPNTPFSPPDDRHAPASSPKATCSPTKPAKRGIKRFQSLSALRPARRARSRAPPSPPITNSRSPADALRTRPQPTAAAKSRKTKCPKILPAPLANELALAQLMDGGSVEDHARRFARSHAKASGAVKENGQLVGVGDVWRDGEGCVWMDCDEAWEYAHLLDKESPRGDWVRFEDSEKQPEGEGERRESVSTQDSDLSPRYAMHTEFDARDDLAAFTCASDRELRKPGMSVLAIPSRSQRSAKHLRKPEFLLNVFPVPLSPKAGGSLSSPRIAAFRTATAKTKVRRRPAPLKLVPPAPASKFPTNPDLDQNRKEFLDSSFQPPASASQLQTTHCQKSRYYQVQTGTSKMTPRSTIMNMCSVLKGLGSKRSNAV